MRYRWLVIAILISMTPLVSPGCSASEGERHRLFIIGQDLGSVSEYVASGCCPQADANTAYLDFYNLTSEQGGYGGLGIDLDGQPIDEDMDWGAGPINAWKSAMEFDGGLAIGLWIAENFQSGGLAGIIAGDFDANIRQLARFISMIEKPVYLRIGYEFDGSWNEGYENQEAYIAAFRRIVSGLRTQQVDNVQFVWQSAAFPPDSLDPDDYIDIRQWYPGDNDVDWIGFSLFMGLDEKPLVVTTFDTPTARELIAKILDFARERSKPVFIGEASPQGYDLVRGTNANIHPVWDGPYAGGVKVVSPDEIWNEWYAPVFELLEANRDVIYAFAYINCNWDALDMWDAPYEGGYWGDTRLQVSPTLAERFSEAIENWRSME